MPLRSDVLVYERGRPVDERLPFFAPPQRIEFRGEGGTRVVIEAYPPQEREWNPTFPIVSALLKLRASDEQSWKLLEEAGVKIFDPEPGVAVKPARARGKKGA